MQAIQGEGEGAPLGINKLIQSGVDKVATASTQKEKKKKKKTPASTNEDGSCLQEEERRKLD